MVVVVFTGLWTGQHDQIIRWWSSNLGQVLLKSQNMLLVITTYYVPLHNLSQPLLGQFYFPLPDTNPHNQRSPLQDLSSTTAPHLLSRSGTASTWMSPTPATNQTPPLVSMPRAACLHQPPYPASISPPFSALGLLPGPCHPLGFFLSWFLPSPMCPTSLPVCCTASLNFLGLGIYGCHN